MNADFNMEERATDIHQGFAAMSLDSGEAGPAKQQSAIPADKNEKQQTTAKEVWIIIACMNSLYILSSSNRRSISAFRTDNKKYGCFFVDQTVTHVGGWLGYWCDL